MVLDTGLSYGLRRLHDRLVADGRLHGVYLECETLAFHSITQRPWPAVNGAGGAARSAACELVRTMPVSSLPRFQGIRFGVWTWMPLGAIHAVLIIFCFPVDAAAVACYGVEGTVLYLDPRAASDATARANYPTRAVASLCSYLQAVCDLKGIYSDGRLLRARHLALPRVAGLQSSTSLDCTIWCLELAERWILELPSWDSQRRVAWDDRKFVGLRTSAASVSTRRADLAADISARAKRQAVYAELSREPRSGIPAQWRAQSHC